MDQAREIGRTIKAAGRVVAWVAEADEDAAAALAMAPPKAGLAGAQAALGRAAAKLVKVDRERAVEESDISLRAMAGARGDEALISRLVHDALERELGGYGAPASARPNRVPAALRAVSA